MKRSILGTAVALLLFVATLVGPSPALATPNTLSPTNGALVAASAQSFSWLDNLSQGPIDHSYMEISTSPEVDYYDFGFFTGNLVYSSGNLTQSSVNLNALGRALAPGTYYWHVNGFYGAYGSLGTAWSGVQSFTVRNASVAAPAIGANPTSLYFAVEQGDTTVHGPQNLAVSNIGGGTLSVWYASDSANATWLWWEDGTTTQYVWTIPISVRATSNPEWNPPSLTPLPVGTYTTNFTLVDAGSNPPASNSPKLVSITLQVFPTDNAGPTGASIAIFGGAALTATRDVVLNLSATDAGSGMGEMRFSNGDGGWSAWVPYAATRVWRLPSGDGVKTVQAQFRDKVGNKTGVVADTIVLDTVAPSKSSLTAPAFSTALSKSGSFPLAWASTDPAPGSGVWAYRVQYRVVPATAWTSWGGFRTSSGASFPGLAGKTYQLRVLAKDFAGNMGPYSDIAKTVVPLNETAATFTGAWKATSQSGAYMGKVKSTRARGAAATFKATGKSFSVLVTKGPGRSKAKVYVDGRLVRTIDTRAVSATYRQLIAIKSFTRAGVHVVRVVNSATAGRTRLDLDGLAAAR